jgi:hypothetical protein
MPYDCSSFHLYSENYTIELPFPNNNGADYSLKKELVKFNFWSGAWAVRDVGLGDNDVQLDGYDWDGEMSVITEACNICATESYPSDECLFNLNCFNNGLHLGRWGICFNPELCIIHNCFPPLCFDDDGEFCFTKTNLVITPHVKVCKKIKFSDDFMTKFENLNALMENHEQVEINELGDCVNGVYVIADFSYEVVPKVPGLFRWHLSLQRVSDIE